MSRDFAGTATTGGKSGRTVVAAGLVATAGAVVLIAGGGPGRPPTRSPLPATAAHPAAAGLKRARRTRAGELARGPGPRAVAVRFAAGYLACAYRHVRCSGLPGALPDLSGALAGRRGAAFVTPAERAARPRITGVRLLYECPDGAVAQITYTDGQGAMFELDPALVRARASWRVWNLPAAGIRSQRWPLGSDC